MQVFCERSCELSLIGICVEFGNGSMKETVHMVCDSSCKGACCRESKRDKHRITFLKTGHGGCEGVDSDKREHVESGFKSVWRCVFKLLGIELN